MKKPADIGGKRLISLAPEKWVKWITQLPEIEVKEFLDSDQRSAAGSVVSRWGNHPRFPARIQFEQGRGRSTADLQWVSRENDILMKVTSPEIGDFLILNELQLRYNNQLPRRMRAYIALVEEKYKLPIYPVLINIIPHGINQRSAAGSVVSRRSTADPQVPTSYESNFQGIYSYQDYRVINLWEVDVRLVFEQKIQTLLPFVPILRGGGEETIVRDALRELRSDESLNELEPLLSFFASYVLELPVVQEIMRWDMAVLRESPWYQQIIKEGLEQGRKTGLEEGRQEGRQEGEVQLILRLLNRRFGNLNEVQKKQIRQLPVEKLEILGEELLEFSSLNDVQTWLNNNQS